MDPQPTAPPLVLSAIAKNISNFASVDSVPEAPSNGVSAEPAVEAVSLERLANFEASAEAESARQTPATEGARASDSQTQEQDPSAGA